MICALVFIARRYLYILLGSSPSTTGVHSKYGSFLHHHFPCYLLVKLIIPLMLWVSVADILLVEVDIPSSSLSSHHVASASGKGILDKNASSGFEKISKIQDKVSSVIL